MWKIIFSGVGGQGIVSAGILIGEAAVIHEGRHAVQTQSYGAQMRGGLSRADITISDHPVMYPKVEQAHLLVCLHQKALTANLRFMRPGGFLITDRSMVSVDRSTDARYFELPIMDGLRDRTGSTRSANLTVLGAVVAITRAVREESLRAAITARFGESRENRIAFDLGLEMVRDLSPTPGHAV